MSSKNRSIKIQEGIAKLPKKTFSIISKVSKTSDKESVVKIKILFVTRPLAPPWDEASKNFAYQLAINVAKINPELEIHLMTKGDLTKYNSHLPKNIVQHPIYTLSQNDITFSQKIRSLIFQWKMKNKFDIVQYFFTPSKINSWVIKNFLYSHKSKTIQTIPTLRKDLMDNSSIKNSVFSDLVITYSNYSKNQLKKIGFSNVQRIYPGIDLNEFSPTKKDSSLLKSIGLTENNFIILFAGEYVRLGGLDDVLETFIEVEKQIPESRLFLALRIKNKNDIQKKREVKKSLKKLGLLSKVIFGDEVITKETKMRDIFNLQDLMVYPIHNMNGKFDIPLVIPESMACQKAVILSNLPLLQEFANHNNAVIINIGDKKELKNAILDLFNNKEERQKIALNGMNFVRKNFDINFIAEEYNDIYQKI